MSKDQETPVVLSPRKEAWPADDGTPTKPAAGADDAQGAAAPPKEAEVPRSTKIKRLLFIVIISLAVTLSVSVASYLIALKLGTYSLASVGEQLQDQIANVVKTEIDRRVDPLVIFLKQATDFIDENQIDVENNSQLRALMPLAHSFLRNYFDDSRCCFGAFVNMQFENDPGPISPPGVLSCHGIEAPSCPAPKSLYNSKAQWVGVLHWSNTYANETGYYSQVLPKYPLGNATNELYFKSYEGGVVMKPENPEKFIGFVPFQYGDGYWFWLNVRYNLTKKQTRFAPIFPFDLYPPVVLKTHVTAPLYSLDGRRVGAMVTGFKLHWISKFLATLEIKPGLFILLVERATGHVVASSNTSFEVLNTTSNKPIRAERIDKDATAARLANQVYERAGRSWPAVTAYHSRGVQSATWSDVLFTTENKDDFIIVFEYKNNYGLDWVGIISVPYDSIMKEIQVSQLSLGIATVFIAVAVRGIGKAIEAGGLLFLFPLVVAATAEAAK